MGLEVAEQNAEQAMPCVIASFQFPVSMLRPHAEPRLNFPAYLSSKPRS